MKLTIPPKLLTLAVVPVSLLLSSCGSTNGTALNIDNQDTSTTTPGNAPISDRMGMEGTGTRTHRETMLVKP